VATGQGSNVYDNSLGKNNYSYYVNWDAILPRNYQKYNVYFSFNSLMTSSVPIFSNSLVILGIDFGGFNANEANGGNNDNLGVISIGTMIGSDKYRYTAQVSDNSPTTINYPSNSIITVGLSEINTMTTFGSPSSTASGSLNIGNYVLVLSFEPVD
jgi:hypothetical protein